jgi:hypothetical protein
MVKINLFPALCLAVKQASTVNGDFQHFFQTNRLGAQLDRVTIIPFGASPFVFDGEGLPPAFTFIQFDSDALGRILHFMKFYHVRHPAQAELIGYDRHGPDDPEITARFILKGSSAFSWRNFPSRVREFSAQTCSI